MKENTRIPFLAGRLSEATSTFILESLKREGMGELLPCHGDILHVLTEQETATVMELPNAGNTTILGSCLLYTSPSPRDRQKSRMPSSA